jgi:hypothetical protein
MMLHTPRQGATETGRIKGIKIRSDRSTGAVQPMCDRHERAEANLTASPPLSSAAHEDGRRRCSSGAALVLSSLRVRWI